MKRTLLVVLCALGLLALSAATASAKPGHGRNGFSGTFQCTKGSQVTVALSGYGRVLDGAPRTEQRTGRAAPLAVAGLSRRRLAWASVRECHPKQVCSRGRL